MGQLVNGRLEIVTLGGFSLQHDTRPVGGFVSRKVEALLVYLAASPREHPREVLGEMLWDDLPQDRTLANLRMALSSLQQQLAPYLTVTRYSLAMNADSDYHMDTLELDRALSEADQHWKENGSFSQTAAAKLENALKLYQGAFLEGFHLRNARGFEGWKLLEQERLRYRVQEALYRLGSHALKRGQYKEGIAYTTRLIQYDPLWEEAHRLLMLLLAHSGNRSAALAQYETCQRLLKENLGVEPSNETFDLYCQIDDGEIKSVVQERVPHNLPASPTAFVGRSKELIEIRAQLSHPNCRLLTLVGPGGVGKTRLALEVARQSISDFAQGVYFVPLSAVLRSDFIAQEIADAIPLPLAGGREPLAELITALQDKRLLLILDNFEHLLESADLLSEILGRTQGLKFLVTSTARLNLQEEWLYPVEGLPTDIPKDPDDLSPAVQLFLQTARRVKRDFVLDSQREMVAQICQLVEGLPLGIELAASWVHVLTCQQIAAQMSQSLDFLSTSLRNLPERHRSLRVLFEQAVHGLDPQQRAAFIRLSLFQGGFTQDAAAQVAGAALATLAALVEKSLLRVPDAGRYDLHTLLSRFAGDLLDQSGELPATTTAYVRYYTELAEKFANRDDDVHIGIEYGNIAHALNAALESQQIDYLMRLVNALTSYWRGRGHISEGRHWTAQALAASTSVTDARLSAATLASAGILAWNQSDFEPARQFLKASLQGYRSLQDPDGICHVLRYLGYVALNTGQFKTAQAHFEEILSIAQELVKPELMLVALGNLGQVAMEQNDLEGAKPRIEESLLIARQHGGAQQVSVLLNNLGNIHLAQSSYAQARQCYEESLAIARTLGHQPNIAFTLVNMGEVAHNLKDYDLALAHYREGLALLKELGDKLSMAAVLESYAYVLIDVGDVERAIRLLGSAQAARESLNAPIPPREQPRYDRYLLSAKTAFDAERFAAVWRAGRLLNLDYVVSEAGLTLSE
jgi:predicted ATPase/DNA-binding SARP family transcriptional activator